MSTKYTSKLQGKRVLVIGGTSGIGFCVAEAAIEHGAIVTVASSQQAKVDRTIQRLLESYPNAKVTGTACDLGNASTTEENVKNLLEFATKEGKLDHIVSTAGDALNLPQLSTVTPERIFAGQQVRLVASAMLAKYAHTYMNVSSASSFTITGGVNTYKPAPGWVIAAATGACVEGLTRGLAVDLKPIRANTVAPGAISTELWQGFTTTKEELEKIEQMYASKTLVGEVGRPEDTAEAYLYLMKDKFVDGQTILTEGGSLLL